MYGFYAESVNFVTELYSDCFLPPNWSHVEGRSVKFSTCSLSGESRAAQSTLWGPCVGAGSLTHLTLSFYVTADQAGVNPAWTAWQQIIGGFFPHFKGSFHHVSQVFYNLSSSAPNLFYSYPRLQRAFYDLFHNAFPTCLENKLRIQFMTRFTLTIQSQNMLSWKDRKDHSVQLWALQRMGNIWCDLTYSQLQPANQQIESWSLYVVVK